MSDRRRAREAKALAIVKAVRPDPSPRAQPLRHTELNGDTPEPTGFIYFLYCAGRIKIGYATEVADRMAQIATHCPFPIRLLLTIFGAKSKTRSGFTSGLRPSASTESGSASRCLGR